ncbi:hypothetical protein [Alysiella filiformis]|uniref:hypothetical protein n=1 Tax=Alysiella filiformis TaxID=194196 RepID=UPI0015CA45D5|nr:hypothetical protein [Alysiella filiformis]QMT31310.1 hypothetical protein H3L97_11595 [Alysiella filiformis]UBQ55684.1 hypothetical protein JF568_08870 [Alysiella filiformis DSM 16848]
MNHFNTDLHNSAFIYIFATKSNVPSFSLWASMTAQFCFRLPETAFYQCKAKLSR